MPDRYYLARFRNAQDFGVYEQALCEVKSSRKQSHWMWYIFPQLRGLGHSHNSWFYGITCAEEARAYLEDATLGPRLREMCRVLMELPESDPQAVFGWDWVKLGSSMTLFDFVAPDDIFKCVLDKFFSGSADPNTLEKLKKMTQTKQMPKYLPIFGAICGDILGSFYENFVTKDINTELCLPFDRFTDDTVCTVAVTDAILNKYPFDDALRKWCRKYPYAGYGGQFKKWFREDNAKPYNSWGNGSAMRVSAAGALAKSLDEALQWARMSAEVTHNHPEGIKGAEATAASIYLARTGASKAEIKAYVEQNFGYDLSRRYADIQPGYCFDVSCQGSVPESIICFLESESYEHCIRLAIAMGGDTDTMGAIAGSIAAAFYGEIPSEILVHCLIRLPQDMGEVVEITKDYR